MSKVKDCQGTQSNPLYVSDELPHYFEAICEVFSTETTPPRTGKPGRPKGPQRVVEKTIDYATVHKTREKGRITKVDINVLLGDGVRIFEKLEESPSQTINTSYVERSNLSWRMMNSHLTRKTICFAKSMVWFKARFAVIVALYNFTRPHSSLKDPTKNQVTPCMAAGITTNPWSEKELLSYPILCQ